MIWGIVVAAGQGRRFGGPKHDARLDGRPLWEHARDSLVDGGVDRVVVVGNVAGGVPGGPRRRDSVWAGLESVPPEASHVLIHDAARPLASEALVRAVIRRLVGGDADGVIPVVPVRDTIKRIDGEIVTETVDRSALVAVQTPQGFVTSALRRAHEASVDDAPDDAALVEGAGGKIVTVPGEPTNLKITYSDDLRVAAALLHIAARVEP